MKPVNKFSELQQRACFRAIPSFLAKEPMKIFVLLISLLIAHSAFASTPYVATVRARCHKSADTKVRSGMTRFQILWANFFSENLSQRPLYLQTYASCMLETARRSAIAARDRQLASNQNMIANIRSRKGTDHQIMLISAKSTICGVNGQNPEKYRILRRGYDYIGRIPNNRQFDWYWNALESFVQSTRVDQAKAFGFCRVDPL